MSSSIVMGEGVSDALGGIKRVMVERRQGRVVHGKGVSPVLLRTEWPRLESRKTEKGKLYDG